MSIFDKFFKPKTMPENENPVVTPETEQPTHTETPPAETTSIVESSNENPVQKSDRELTKEVLAKAIASFETENPGKQWEEVDQDTRWNYLDKAY